MKKPKIVITEDEWLKALSEFEQGQTDTVPAGWLTFQEVRQRIGKCEGVARTFMDEMIADGKAEKKSFRVRAGTMIRAIVHYRLKK